MFNTTILEQMFRLKREEVTVMNNEQHRIVQAINDELRLPRFMRSDFGIEKLLGDLARTDGYTGDPILADEYGVDTLARLGGHAVLPTLERLRNHAGSVMQQDVDAAIRKHNIK